MMSDVTDELQLIMANAGSRLVLIARDLDANFVFRYLAFTPPGITVTLLVGRKTLATLLPAVDAFAEKNGVRIYVRSRDDNEFRCVFVTVDDAQYYSGGDSLMGDAKTGPYLSHERDPIYMMGAMQAVSKLMDASRVERGDVVGR